MLKRTVRQAAETIGLIPSLADATTAADIRRKALTDAQGAVEAARVALDAAHDAGAPAAAIQQAEAAAADAQITADRAQASCAAAERRLNAALEDERAETRAAAKATRDNAMAAFDRAASEIDRLAEQIAEQVAIINKQYEQFNISRTAGVAGPYMPVTGGTLATLAIERAISAQTGKWVENSPSAAQAGARVTGAVMVAA